MCYNRRDLREALHVKCSASSVNLPASRDQMQLRASRYVDERREERLGANTCCVLGSCLVAVHSACKAHVPCPWHHTLSWCGSPGTTMVEAPRLQ